MPGPRPRSGSSAATGWRSSPGTGPAWLYVELGAQSAGAIPLGIFVDSLPDQVQRILEHSEARFVLVEDQEQADKVLSVRDALPRLERIIVDDMRGLEDYGDPMVVGLEAVAEEGRALDSREGHLYEELLERGSPTDVALLAYTSGTTGAAKAAMLSHRNLLAMAAGVTEVDPLRESDEIVSFLPFAWVGEQLLSVAIALHVGATVNFPEEPETLREDLREIGPHVMIAPPRFWEAMCSEYQVKIDDAGFFKRAATRAALAIGERLAARRTGRPPQASPGARCTASPTSWRSGPCSTSSACRASGTRTPAAPRSAPRSSSSSGPSAST